MPKMKNKPKHQLGSWQEVKLSGNLITDDSVGTLEGLIGLEVLEDYDGKLINKIKPQRTKLKRKQEPKQESDKSSGYDSDEGAPSKETQPKKGKKAKEPKKSKQVPEEVDNEPGRFVRMPRDFVPTEEEEVEDEESEDVTGLEAWQQFGLSNLILRAIKESGFTKPTEIQRLTLPSAIMGRRDILGAAETGSGKTLAFGLPVLNGILELKEKMKSNPDSKLRKVGAIQKNRADRDNLTPPPEELSDEEVAIKPNERPLFALVLTPTRELAVQVRDHIKTAAKYTGIKVAAIFGGLAVVKQERLLKGCPEIVVATPGRLWELLKEGNQHLGKIDDIHFLVIDETDRMVEKGHFEELKLLMERINRNVTKKAHRQNFIFSATLTMVHDIPDHLKKKNMNRRKKIEGISVEQKTKSLIDGLGISQPKIVDITQSQGTAESLTECRIVCSIKEKDYYLYYFLQKHPGRTIVFCNSIDCVRRLHNLFSLLGCRPLPLHANMIQKQRLKNLERFRDNEDSFLVATDVAARGLDIPKVEHVIHYQVPRTSENYVHRSGRTARANREGIAVLLMEPGEAKNYEKLCKTLKRNDDIPMFPVSYRHLSAVKDIVNLAREVDVLDLKLRKEQRELGWIEKTADEMEILLSGSEDDKDDIVTSRRQFTEKKNKALKGKRTELSKMLQVPLFPRGFSYKYPTATGELAIPMMGLKTSENAVSVMKTAIKENAVLMKGKLLKAKKKKRPVKKVDKREVKRNKEEEDQKLKGTKKVIKKRKSYFQQ